MRHLKLVIFLLSLFVSGAGNSESKRLNPEILFFEGLDWPTFYEQYSQSQKDLRRQYIDEVAGLLYLGAMPEEATKIVQYFDNQVKLNRKNAKKGLGKTLSAEFSSFLQKLYDYHQPTQGTRLVFNSIAEMPADYSIYGVYSIFSTSSIRLSLYIVNHQDNSSFSISHQGSVITVAQNLARSLFDFFHRTRFPAKVPRSHLSAPFVIQKLGRVGAAGSMAQNLFFAHQMADKNCNTNRSRLPRQNEFLDVMSLGKYHGGWSLRMDSRTDRYWALGYQQVFDSFTQEFFTASTSRKTEQLNYLCIAK